MEDGQKSLTTEEKAAIEARIAEVDQQLAELDERPDRPKQRAVLDNGSTRPVKVSDLHLDSAADVEIKEPEWLVPGYIPKYGITTIAG